MTFMLSAGEASGDLHASQLIAALRAQRPDADFCFLGGDLMAQASGRRPLIHYRDMAYMGFAEVLRHLPQVRRNLQAAKQLLARVRPAVLILVDYPSFNLRLAQEAKRLGIPVVYYISPKVWAWKKWRVKDIKRLCSCVLGIFPFEPEFFRREGYDHCSYVGNPSVEEIDQRLAAAPAHDEFCQRNALSSKPLLAIVPGSRLSEIRTNLPIMLEAIKPLAGKFQPVVAGAPGVDKEIYPEGLPVIFGQTTALMAHARAALVTSGTASLEAALARTPQVVCYRHSGSRLMYAALSQVLSIPFVSLPNLVAEREVVPELLMHKCTPQAVIKALAAIIPDGAARRAQLAGYDLIRQRLGSTPAAATAARAILDLCREGIR